MVEKSKIQVLGVNWKMVVLVALFAMTPLAAQKNMAPPLFSLKLEPASFQNGDTLDLVLAVTLDSGWHINSDKPLNEFSIATTLTLDNDSLVLEKPVFPQAQVKFIKALGMEMDLYEGTFEVRSRVWQKASGVALAGNLIFGFQACSDELCLRPDEALISLTGESGPLAGPTQSQGTGVIALSEAPPAVASPGGLDFGGPLVWVVLGLLLGGLALNLTPCVYPLIAITVSLFGDQGKRSTAGRVAVSSFYVGGMVLSFSILGVTAALSGSLFGSALQSATAQIVIALIFAILAMSSFGLFEIRLPSGLMGKAMSMSNTGGYVGGFLAGIFAGVLAAPCIGPIVLTLIVYIAQQNNVWTGFWMFSTLALGMGLPYIILGSASGLVTGLPRSGEWMVSVKKVFGVILLALANYYLRAFMSEMVYSLIFTALLIYIGLYIGPFRVKAGIPRMLSMVLQAGALGTVLFGVWEGAKGTGLDRLVIEKGEAMDWQDYSEHRLHESKLKARYTLVDFESKIWCAACREMEEKTYSMQNVYDATVEMTLLKVDVDKHPDAKVLQEQYGIHGIPVVVVIDPTGKIIHKFVGFIPPDEFVSELKRLTNVGEI